MTDPARGAATSRCNVVLQYRDNVVEDYRLLSERTKEVLTG